MTDITPSIGLPPTELVRRQVRPLALFDRSLIVPAIWASFKKLDPRTLAKNPVMFCVEIVSVLTTRFFIRDLVVGGSGVIGSNALFFRADHHLAVVHGAVCKLRRGGGRGPRQGPGRCPAPDAHRNQSKADPERQSTAFDLVDAVALKAGDLRRWSRPAI